MSIIYTFSICFGLIFLFLTYKVFKSAKKKPITGVEGMIGEIGVVKQVVNDKAGKIFVRGELWNARSIFQEEIPLNTRVRVERMEGFVFFVKKM